MATSADGTMLVGSNYDELQPDIYIRVGKKAVPCHWCGQRAIYQYGEMIVCHKCGAAIQSTLNRLKDQ